MGSKNRYYGSASLVFPVVVKIIRNQHSIQVAIVFAILLGIYHAIFHRFFPTPQGTVGHDFGWSLPLFVDGYIWAKKNGILTVPWFTPSFCAGAPGFPDPQSAYFSLPQWLTFVTDPLQASYITLLISASMGYFGTYLLARKPFSLSVPWSILAASTYLFCGFLPYRMIVGEVSYHALSNVPLLAIALLTPAQYRVKSTGLAVIAGLLAAYWLQAGAPMLIAPTGLSVLLLILVYRLVYPWPHDLLMRLPIAGLVTLLLSASKLSASLAYYKHFERTQYTIPGFDDLLALLATNLLALFGPSEAAFSFAIPRLVNMQVAAKPHEWAYGFTLMPLFIFTLFILSKYQAEKYQTKCIEPTNPWPSKVIPNKRISVAIIVTVTAAVPLALQFYTPDYNAWLKGLPLIGASPWPMRWLITYLPVVPVATALLGQAALGNRQQSAPLLVATGIVMLIGFSLAENREYYANQPYNPQRLLAGYAALAAGHAYEHRIRQVSSLADADMSTRVENWIRNEDLVYGVTQERCYNPIFGYILESLPPSDLIQSNTLSITNGHINIRNPACYVFPDENHCQPGDQFITSQQQEAELFVTYHPFPFNKSEQQHIADILTLLGLTFVAVFTLMIWPYAVWRRTYL